MKLETSRLILRDYEEADWEKVHLYASLPKFSQYDEWGPNSINDTKNFIEDSIKKAQKSPRYQFEFAIILKEKNLLIGGLGIRRDWESGSVANIGYAINPNYQKKGYATEATSELISFGFNQLKLAVIYATCDTQNSASVRVLEKAGLKKVGHIKNHKEMKGRMRDSFCFEILTLS